MSEFKCPFCGSTELMIDRGDQVELDGKMNARGEIEYRKVRDFCCDAQKKNADYRKKNFHPDDAPDIEEVSKL